MSLADYREFTIEQKILSVKDRVNILDPATRQEIGHFESSYLSAGAEYWLRDHSGFPHVYVRQKVLAFPSRYNFYQVDDVNEESKENHIGVLKKQLSFSPKYVFEDNLGRGDIFIQGNFTGLNFEVFLDGRSVARISNEFLSIRNTYGLQLDPDLSPGLTLVILCIVIVLHYEK